MSVNVAVVGATGAVGDLMRKVLAERAFPIKSIKFLASEKSAGKTVEFNGETVHGRTAPPRGVRGRADRPQQHAGFGQQGVLADRREGRRDRRR